MHAHSMWVLDFYLINIAYLLSKISPPAPRMAIISQKKKLELYLTDDALQREAPGDCLDVRDESSPISAPSPLMPEMRTLDAKRRLMVSLP